MNTKKLLLIFLFLFGIVLFVSGCEIEQEVDYDLILENSLDQVKIPGIATTANRDFSVPLELKVTHEEKEYTIILSWVSSDTSVISIEGNQVTVTRPEEGDAQLDLTCTLTLEGKTKEKKFTLTVYEKELTAEDILDEAEEELRSLVDALNINSITKKVTLPNIAGLASVAWSSENISVITSTGDVSRPSYGDGNATVKMTATLTTGVETREIIFNFIILEQDRPEDSEIPALAADYLVIKTEDVVSDLELVTSGRFETTIEWESDNPSIISNTGVVNRPKASTGGFVSVGLTATITYKGYTFTKNFVVQVLELEPKDNQEKAEVAFHNLGLDFVIVSEEIIELPLTSTFDTTFVYTSDNQNISINGGVVNIERLSEDYVAQIKATTVISDVTYEFRFSFVVKSTSKGSGTVADPFVIENAEDLAKVGTGLDGWDLESHYILYNNIDLSTVSSESLGSWTPIGSRTTPFNGTFNGNGYTVSNLYVKVTDGDGVGLFGGIYKATIKNLYVKDSYVEGNMRVATVAGYASSSTVQNVFVERADVVALLATDCQAGGLIGLAEVTVPAEETMFVENCSVVDVNVTGQFHVGGLIGRVTNNITDDNDKEYHAIIKDVYAKATIYANRRQGGLFGSFTGKLENAVVDTVLKAHPSPSNTQNVVALLIAAIEYKGGQSPMTSISNVVFNGDMQEIIDLSSGRTSTLFAFKGMTDDFILLENIYMTCEPYMKNGSSDYNEGANGVQITMENATSNSWYSSVLKSFDFNKVWKISNGSLPTIQYQKDNSAYERAMEVFLNIPSETTEDLNLVTDTYLKNIVVSWESDNAAIGIDGTVVRPAYVDGDLSVNLIARYTINGKEYEKEFAVLVKAEEPTEEEMFNTVKAEMDATLDLEEVVDNLTLLTSGSFNAQISWTSDNAAIDENGIVTRPNAGNADVTVKLVAEVVINGVTREYEYTFVVKAWPNSELALNEVYESLVFDDIVTENLLFAESKEANNLTVYIKWSSNHSAISNTGVVTRPTYLEGDALVTVTAVLTCGDFTNEKVFEITVKALDATDEEMVIEAVSAINNVLVQDLVKTITLPELKENVSVSCEIVSGYDFLSFVGNSLVVVRPSYSVGDVDYALTFTISYNTATDTITLTGKVLKDMGDGSEANPFVIDSLELLESIGIGDFKLNSHYILKNNIDMSSKYNSASALSWTPITNFGGTFDGGNHTISNLYINGTLNYQGLFGRLTNGVVIRNLNIVDADITARQNAGILAGQINTNSAALIENIMVTGKVVGINGTGDTITGGLFGAIDSRVDAGKSANVVVQKIKLDVDVVGCQNVGGVVGNVKMNKGTNQVLISDIEVRGTVSGNQKLGGVFGQIERNNSGTLTGSEEFLLVENIVSYVSILFNADNDKNPSGVGGFVGQLSHSSIDIMVNLVNCIVYNSLDAEAFANVPSVGWYASFGGRSPQADGIILTDCYINGEVFGYDGTNIKESGNILGSQLEEEKVLDFAWYTDTLHFSADLWELGETGLELI